MYLQFTGDTPEFSSVSPEFSTPPPLSFDPTFMKDVECAEYNDTNSPIFILRVIVKNALKIGVMTSQNYQKMTITEKINYEF